MLRKFFHKKPQAPQGLLNQSVQARIKVWELLHVS